CRIAVVTIAGTTIEVPEGALCLGCNYALRGLPTSRCPECGREFDPVNVLSMRLPGWWQWLLRWSSRPAARLLYLWPLAAASLMVAAWMVIIEPTWRGWEWSDRFWRASIWLWSALLVVWVVRLRSRQRVVPPFSPPPSLLSQEMHIRRFTCACFLIALLVTGWT